jgi:hypothetical protein
MIYSEDQDEAPPLEDMSTFINNRKSLQKPAVFQTLQRPKTSEKVLSKPKLLPEKEFSSLAKGFLTHPKVKVKAEIPFIKSKINNTLEFPQVQKAMNDLQPQLNSTELYSKLEKSSGLRQALNDPLFAKAAEKMGKDPSSINLYAKTHPHWIEALKEFCGILGNELVNKPQKLDKEEQKFVDNILGNSKIKVLKYNK